MLLVGALFHLTVIVGEKIVHVYNVHYWLSRLAYGKQSIYLCVNSPPTIVYDIERISARTDFGFALNLTGGSRFCYDFSF